MPNSQTSTATQVHSRIKRHGRGSVVVPADFLDLGHRDAIDSALGRLVASEQLRRIARGVYDYPKVHPRFGLQAPAPGSVAAAVARSTGESLCVDAARAAHQLGVTTQVSAQALYLTDGTNRTLHIDLGEGRGFDLVFKRSTRRAGGDSTAGLVLRALRFLGRDGVDAATLTRLRKRLATTDLRDLAKLRSKAVGWMRPHLDDLLSGSEFAQLR